MPIKTYRKGLIRLGALLCLGLLAACSSAPPARRPSAPAHRPALALHRPPVLARVNIRLAQRPSPNHGMRQRFLVIHYTAADLDRSLQIFADPRMQVSAHYLVPEYPLGGTYFVYQLVPESQTAWHAGVSYWQGYRLLNESSIGIELVNDGFPSNQERTPLMERSWAPFPRQQIQALGVLAQGIVNRYHILPTHVVGHMDIAPGRKSDPGPRFPWETLYRQFGIGAWPDPAAVAYYQRYAPWNGDVIMLQKKLRRYGYDVPLSGVLDHETVDAISAFQMHFYPVHYEGRPDTATVARLDALLEKYFGQPRPRPY